MQKSFFSVVQLLLNHLSLKEVRELDCTSQQSMHFYLKIFEALSFPFEEIDNSMLIDLKLLEGISFLLRWAKGNSINEDIIQKFNKTNFITSLKVHNEEEYQESQHDGIECFSLNTVNRLVGEYEHDPTSTSLKFCLQITRGDDKLLPVTEIFTGSCCPESFEAVEGNINEQSSEIFLYLRRSEPQPDLSFLTRIEMIEDNPVALQPTFTSFDQLLIKQPEQKENEKRQERKKLSRTPPGCSEAARVHLCGQAGAGLRQPHLQGDQEVQTAVHVRRTAAH